MKPLVELSVPLPDVLHEMGGEYRVKGSRITLYHVVSAYHNGIAPHAMVFYYPTLSLDEIEKVIGFYNANRVAVDEFMAAYQATLDQQRSTGKTLDTQELRRRFEAIRAEKGPTGANGQAPHAAAPPPKAPTAAAG